MKINITKLINQIKTQIKNHSVIYYEFNLINESSSYYQESYPSGSTGHSCANGCIRDRSTLSFGSYFIIYRICHIKKLLINFGPQHQQHMACYAWCRA